MTLSISFYNGIKYTKDDFMNRDRDFFGNGVVQAGDFALTFPTTPDMTCSVLAGVAWVDGYRIALDRAAVLTFEAASTQDRIDIVQIGHDDLNSVGSLQVKKGVPGSAIEPDADQGYMKLYAVLVQANTTSVGASNVTDRRQLVPLNVSGEQIVFQGDVKTTSNTFTGTQTAPSFVATSQSAPLQLPNLTALPSSVGSSGTVCMVNGTWYVSDGTHWMSMAPPLQPATATVLGGVKQGSGVTIDADGKISVTPYTLPSDVAKTDRTQTWTTTQTFAAGTGFQSATGATLLLGQTGSSWVAKAAADKTAGFIVQNVTGDVILSAGTATSSNAITTMTNTLDDGTGNASITGNLSIGGNNANPLTAPSVWIG